MVVVVECFLVVTAAAVVLFCVVGVGVDVVAVVGFNVVLTTSGNIREPQSV